MAAMPVPFIDVQNLGQDLAQKTVCVRVRLGRIGNTRKVSNSQVEVDTDKSLIRVSKHLLDSKELRAVANFDAEVRRYLYDTCLPFEAGIHLCPLALLEQMEGKLREFAAGRADLVQAFLSAYPVLCQEAAQRLRSLYNPTDYPPADYVAQQFTFNWQYISFGVPDQLREISTKIWQDEREKAAQVMAEAGREIQQVLRTAMAELVKHMRDWLKEGPDGKPLKFKESTVSKLVEFLDIFEFRNVTDDSELTTLVEKARGLLKGVDSEDLRATAHLRAKVQQGMAEIAAQLDTMVIKKATRKFRMEEE
jgi:Protein of unknown function (DUF3150)